MKNSICFIGGGLSGGGQERAMVSLANEFAKRGYKVSILNLFKTEVAFDLESEIKVIWPLVDRKKNRKYIYAAKLIPFIYRNIKQQNPEVVISFGDWFNAYTLAATRFLKVKVFITNRWDLICI